MKTEIEDYYFNMVLPVSAIINKLLPEKISKPAIQAAIESIWNQVDKGEIEVKRARLVNEVRKKAKYIEASENKEIYTRKYESERIELKELRVKKLKYESIRRSNICDNFIFHGIYGVVIGSVVALVYFLGGN